MSLYLSIRTLVHVDYRIFKFSVPAPQQYEKLKVSAESDLDKYSSKSRKSTKSGQKLKFLKVQKIGKNALRLHVAGASVCLSCLPAYC